jgi:hypothetical protein
MNEFFDVFEFKSFHATGLTAITIKYSTKLKPNANKT